MSTRGCTRRWLERALLTSLLLSLNAATAGAQFKDYGKAGLGGGVSLGGVLTRTELADAADYQIRAYVNHGLAENLAGEIGVGYASLSGSHYLSDVVLADVRVRYSLHPSQQWGPFAYVGAGVLRYDWSTASGRRTDDAKPIGWSAVLPVGVGLKYKLTNRLAVDLSGGYNYTFRDDINSASLRKGNDVFWGIRLGIDLGSDPDADADGLLAGAEGRAGTDVRLADTDGDGLTDGEELHLHHTDPLRADTDGDGRTDGLEITLHFTDPRVDDRQPAAPAAEVTLGAASGMTAAAAPEETVTAAAEPDVRTEEPPVFAPLHFTSGHAALDARGAAEVARLFDFLSGHPEMVVELRGYTDSHGSMSVNRRLAQERAGMVKAQLVTMGIAAERITAVGLGPEKPIAPNSTAEGRRLNRRVELVVAGAEQGL